MVRDFRREIVFAFMLALACYVAWLVRDVLVLLYVSALFAVVLNPVVRVYCRGFTSVDGGRSRDRRFSFSLWARRWRLLYLVFWHYRP